jgi:hypothetical protein
VRAQALPASAPEPEIDLFEMANLSSDQTGIPGVIYISTRAASHAPRIKWYPDRPREGAPSLSITIEEVPQVFMHDLSPRHFSVAADQAKAWVEINREALLDFWHNGTSWMDSEVTDFKKALRRLS